MIKKIFAVVALIIVVVMLHIGFIAHKTYSITRETRISAAPNVVFAMINNPKTYSGWNPFAKADPSAKITFDGPAEGVGAAGIWDGNAQMGAGKMTVTESQPGNMVKYHFDFERPFKEGGDEVFSLKPDGNGTIVTWNMSGDNNFVTRFMSVYMGLENQIGDTLASGLATMKSQAESQASRLPSAQ